MLRTKDIQCSKIFQSIDVTKNCQLDNWDTQDFDLISISKLFLIYK